MWARSPIWHVDMYTLQCPSHKSQVTLSLPPKGNPGSGVPETETPVEETRLRGPERERGAFAMPRMQVGHAFEASTLLSFWLTLWMPWPSQRLKQKPVEETRLRVSRTWAWCLLGAQNASAACIWTLKCLHLQLFWLTLWMPRLGQRLKQKSLSKNRDFESPERERGALWKRKMRAWHAFEASNVCTSHRFVSLYGCP